MLRPLDRLCRPLRYAALLHLSVVDWKAQTMARSCTAVANKVAMVIGSRGRVKPKRDALRYERSIRTIQYSKNGLGSDFDMEN